MLPEVPGYVETVTRYSSDTEHSAGVQVEVLAKPELIDIYAIHEKQAGRLVLELAEARKEFGEEIASKLKLSSDGKYVLWPQPLDNPEDPQNWSDRKKNIQLLIVILASIVPEFDLGIGIAALFALSRQYHTTTGEINDLTTNWSLFISGWSGMFFVVFIRRYGRLSTLFWTQLFSLAFLVGATFSPTLKIFAAMRCLTAFFGRCPAVTGLYTITDVFPFHIQARKINFWTMATIIAPQLSPFVFGFLVARASWRWAYGIGCIYSLFVLLLIVFFFDESLYNRRDANINDLSKPSKAGNSIIRRLKNISGVTGVQNTRNDSTWKDTFVAPLRLVWRPHMFLMFVFQALVFRFSIGINVTVVVILQSPRPPGFGLSATTAAAVYATPIVAIFIGHVLGRYLNDYFMNRETKRNKGIFEAEARLWTLYIGVLLYVCGFVLLGSALEDHLNLVGVVIGWGVALVAVLVITVAGYAYCIDCFPQEQGEISALLTLARGLGGIGVAFYQVPWSERSGALYAMGCEAAIVAGCFLFFVPFLQLRGTYLRAKFSIKH